MNQRIRAQISRRLCFALLLMALALFVRPSPVAHAATMRYVQPSTGNDSGGANNCSNKASPCKTLSNAITHSASDDTIYAAVGTYSVASNGETLPLNITINLTINGAGAGSTILDGSNSTRLFEIGAVTVNLTGMTIKKGNDNGVCCSGGIYDSGSNLTLTNVAMVDNVSSTGGGAIFSLSGGTLTITKSVFTNNTDSYCCGGAIFVWGGGTLTITGSTFQNNSASGCCGGAIYGQGYSNVTIDTSTFSNNSAECCGGAIHLAPVGVRATIARSTFNGNSTGTGCCGGAIYARGIREVGTGVTVANSTFFGNNANGLGGAYYNDYYAYTNFINVTFSGNSAGRGSHPTTRTELTFSRTPKGISVAKTEVPVRLPETDPSASGGAIGGCNSNPFQLVFCPATVENTILANNTPDNCTGTITDGGNNLQFNPNSGCGGTIPFGDPKLAALANNGGPTLTMALQTGSAAIDKANNAICAASPVNNLDQRSFPRPRDGDGDGIANCDVGAFEVQAPTAPLPTPAPVAPAEVPEADTLLLLCGGLGGLATWMGWQRRKLCAKN